MKDAAYYLVPAILTLGSLVFYFFLSKPQKPVLSKTEARDFPLTEKTIISHNTAIYRFGLPKGASLNLPLGQHISLIHTHNGKPVMRSYTPITNNTIGYFDLLIKTYPTGVLSSHVASLTLGDCISVKGPKGAFVYNQNMCSHLTMIAGGTGITPMYQLIQAITSDPMDRTKIRLIYANVSINDILLKRELDAYAKENAQFEVYYVLNEAPENWLGGVGFITKSIVEEHGYAYQERNEDLMGDRKCLVCGPPPMVTAVIGMCETLGYPKAQTISKMSDGIFKF